MREDILKTTEYIESLEQKCRQHRMMEGPCVWKHHKERLTEAVAGYERHFLTFLNQTSNSHCEIFQEQILVTKKIKACEPQQSGEGVSATSLIDCDCSSKSKQLPASRKPPKSCLRPYSAQPRADRNYNLKPPLRFH